jgi:hypothetical protein
MHGFRIDNCSGILLWSPAVVFCDAQLEGLPEWQEECHDAE